MSELLENTHRFLATSVGRVYIIRNDVNDLVYIGSTSLSLNARLQNHKRASVDERNASKWNQAMRQIGVAHFSIDLLEEIEDITADELLDCEFAFIDVYSAEELYNTDLVRGCRSEETRAKISTAHIGKKATDSTKAKLSIAHTGKTGRKTTDATKAKQSVAHTAHRDKQRTSGKIRGSIRRRPTSFQFRWTIGSVSSSKSFSFNINTTPSWDQEEAYFHAQQFRDTIFPVVV